jgi:hypothetical protein
MMISKHYYTCKGNCGAQCLTFIYNLFYNWKTMLPQMLLYCTQLDCTGVGTYAFGGRQCKRRFPNGVLETSIV